MPILTGHIDTEAATSGFEKAGEDISEKERSKKSIVMISWSHAERLTDVLDLIPMKKAISRLFDLGVPVVVLAGNYAIERDWPEPSKEVDEIPASLAGDKFPLIVVGSTDLSGAISSFSQRGDKVTSYTVGENIKCEGLEGPITISGTSFGRFLPSIFSF